MRAGRTAERAQKSRVHLIADGDQVGHDSRVTIALDFCLDVGVQIRLRLLQRIGRPCGGHPLRTAAVEQERELNTHSEIFSPACQVEILRFGFRETGISLATRDTGIDVRRC